MSFSATIVLIDQFYNYILSASIRPNPVIPTVVAQFDPPVYFIFWMVDAKALRCHQVIKILVFVEIAAVVRWLRNFPKHVKLFKIPEVFVLVISNLLPDAELCHYLSSFGLFLVVFLFISYYLVSKILLI